LRRTSKKDGIRTYSSDKDLVDSKRKEIVDQATKVFIKKGYHQTNMRELAEALNMSVGSIYNYVGSKQDILYLIIHAAVTRPEGWVESISTSLKTTAATRVLTEFIRMHYTAIDRGHISTLFTYQETRNLDRKARQVIMNAAAEDVETCAIILQKGVEKGEFQINNMLLMAHNIIVLGHMWAIRWWYLSKVCSLDEYIEEQTALILSRITVK
jgi:TetR/AcrR family transcriptional regulator, cholesterol catabolism regulator